MERCPPPEPGVMPPSPSFPGTGRTGRVAAGTAIHLFTRKFHARPPGTRREIECFSYLVAFSAYICRTIAVGSGDQISSTQRKSGYFFSCVPMQISG